MKENKIRLTKLFNYIIVPLIFIAIIAFCVIYLKYDTLLEDDSTQCFLINSHFFIFPDHGRYLATFFIKVLGFIVPNHLGIHPNDFDAVIMPYLKGMAVICICFLFTQMAFVCKNNKTFWPILLIINSLVLLGQEHYNLSINVQFFGYTFNLIFFFGFWGLFLKHYLNDSKISNKELCLMTISAFFLAISNEILNIASIITFISLMICEKLFKLSSDKIKKQLFGLPFIFFVIGMFAYYVNPGFQSNIESKQIYIQSINLVGITNILPEFIKSYWNIIILEKILLLLFIFSLVALLWTQKGNENKNKKITIFVISMLFGVLLFFATLITGGKSFYYNNLFWLSHYSLNSLYKIILISCIYVLLSGLLENIEQHQKNIKLSYIIWGLIFITSFTLIIERAEQTYKDIKRAVFCQEESQKNLYTLDKIFRFYDLKGETIVLPLDCLTKMYECNRHIELIPLAKYDRIEKYNNGEIITVSAYSEIYYPSVYKKKISKGYYFLSSKEAMRIFKENGGKFTSEELKNIKFERLYNNDFVLKK